MQKLGYYKLHHLAVEAGDWMVIIDASIQIGDRKCLMVIGCPVDSFPQTRTLTLKDLTPLYVRVIQRLTSDDIKKALQDVRATVGNITSVCSDRGSDVLLGIKKFRKTSPHTRLICDTAHRVSNLLQSALEPSERWKCFRKLVTQAGREMQNSKVAGARPPRPRMKARFMNVDSIIQWAADMLLLMKQPDELSCIQKAELVRYLGWLDGYEADIAIWISLVEMGKRARHLVREEGIHSEIPTRFIDSLAGLPLCSEGLYYSDLILDFLLIQVEGMKKNERYIGSTEVIESVFGKLKAMEREQTAFGFTSLVLAAIAHIGPFDTKTVEAAISKIKVSDIQNWSDKEIGVSIQSERRMFTRCINHIKKIMDTKPSGVLEGEAAGF